MANLFCMFKISITYNYFECCQGQLDEYSKFNWKCYLNLLRQSKYVDQIYQSCPAVVTELPSNGQIFTSFVYLKVDSYPYCAYVLQS